MQVLLAVFILVPLVAASGEDPVRKPETFASPNTKRGIKYVTDLVTVSQNPTVPNMFKLTSQMSSLDTILGVADVASLVADILGIPDPDKEEARRQFERLLQEIINVKQDVKRLEEQIEWGNRQLQYSHVVNVISTATDLCNKIASATTPAERKRRQDRFKEHCANQGLQMSVDVLYNGLTGKGAFATNILSAYYRTSRGHRPNLVKLSSRLIQMVSGGLMSLMAYEGLVRGIGGAKDMARDYQPRMAETKQSTEFNINRCSRDYATNIVADLTTYHNDNPGNTNAQAALGLTGYLKEKYDWMVFCVVVYNPTTGTDRHYYRYNLQNGTSKLNYPQPVGAKHSFIFYKRKNEPFVGAGKKTAALAILQAVDGDRAGRAVNAINTRLIAAGIDQWALMAFRKQATGTVSGNAGGRLVTSIGRDLQKIVLLS